MVEVITIRDVASLRSGQATKFLDSFPFSSSSLFFPQNLPLISAFLVFALAQFLNASRPGPSYKEKRWDSKRVLNSDGIPWSPSATVSVLAVAIGLQEGSGSSSFTIAIVLACILNALLLHLGLLLISNNHGGIWDCLIEFCHYERIFLFTS
ncbi:Acid phosphatase/vanadium-dependent haloperoxidase-related protein [Citrus sinensis]|uniref:Acid phosphatase/vanadium-dependent haloperoxidase-related protein n=1 Tax=Citrus sinensis TaxID=2711 RepID=A0ACB8JFD6_CITSI|nr:Acid phosphatase/vanadium-dependent haloperoxidase-related protein [Citrus sinensis]